MSCAHPNRLSGLTEQLPVPPDGRHSRVHGEQRGLLPLLSPHRCDRPWPRTPSESPEAQPLDSPGIVALEMALHVLEHVIEPLRARCGSAHSARC